jgi:hypothetical protein
MEWKGVGKARRGIGLAWSGMVRFGKVWTGVGKASRGIGIAWCGRVGFG